MNDSLVPVVHVPLARAMPRRPSGFVLQTSRALVVFLVKGMCLLCSWGRLEVARGGDVQGAM